MPSPSALAEPTNAATSTTAAVVPAQAAARPTGPRATIAGATALEQAGMAHPADAAGDAIDQRPLSGVALWCRQPAGSGPSSTVGAAMRAGSDGAVAGAVTGAVVMVLISALVAADAGTAAVSGRGAAAVVAVTGALWAAAGAVATVAGRRWAVAALASAPAVAVAVVDHLALSGSFRWGAGSLAATSVVVLAGVAAALALACYPVSTAVAAARR